MPDNTARKPKKPEVIKLLREGKKPSEIAKTLGVSTAYVSKVKKELEMGDFQTEGELEATVFKLFKEGRSPVDVVIELKLPAEKVEELYYKYLNLVDLPPVKAIDVMKNIDKKFQRAKVELSRIFNEHIRKFDVENTEKIKGLREEMERNRSALVGTLKEVTALMTYLAIKEAINIASIPAQHPREHVDIGFIKRIIRLFKTTTPSDSDIRVFVDYLKLHRDVLRGSGNVKGARMLDEILTMLTKG